MAHRAPGRVALFSIRPRYAEAILDGSKRVEFRRRGLSDDVTHVVIYVTAPVQRVVGFFDVLGTEHAAPEVLWHRYRRVGGIDLTAYDDYFQGCQDAFAIRVGTPARLRLPVPLLELHPDLRPPQSYQYLDGAMTAKVFGAARVSGHDHAWAGVATAHRGGWLARTALHTARAILPTGLGQRRA